MGLKRKLNDIIVRYFILFLGFTWCVTATILMVVYNTNLAVREENQKLRYAVDFYQSLKEEREFWREQLVGAVERPFDAAEAFRFSRSSQDAFRRLTDPFPLEEPILCALHQHFDQYEMEVENLCRGAAGRARSEDGAELRLSFTKLEQAFEALHEINERVYQQVDQIQAERIHTILQGQEITIVLSSLGVGLLYVVFFNYALPIIRKWTSPLELLSRSMSAYSLQDETETPDTDHMALCDSEIQEISRLGESYQLLRERIARDLEKIHEQHELIRQSKEQAIHKLKLEKELERYKVRLMQAQINPHFLYNSLNAIANSAYLNDDRETYRYIVSLSKLLRYSTEQFNEFSHLEDELEQLGHYLELRNSGRGIPLRLHRKIEKETERVVLPKLTLQPLVENCFEHAFDSTPDPLIYIESFIWGKQFFLLVCDNGLPFPADLLQAARRPDFFENRSSNIGLSSVYWRLVDIYGKTLQFIFLNDGPTLETLIHPSEAIAERRLKAVMISFGLNAPAES